MSRLLTKAWCWFWVLGYVELYIYNLTQAYAQQIGDYRPLPMPSSEPTPLLTRPAPMQEQGTVQKKPQGSLRGYDKFYAGANAYWVSIEEKKRDPTGAKSATDAKYALSFSGLIGWGPIYAHDFLFFTHYSYDMNWGTDASQIQRFLDKWIESPQAETFIFPTRQLVRTHSLLAHMRYIHPHLLGGVRWGIGSVAKLEFNFTGSSLLGEKDESVENLLNAEEFTPYISLQWGKVLSSYIYSPFRTFVNKDDPTLTHATYSWNTRGRGRLLSLGVNNNINIASLQSTLLCDVFYLRYKFSSIVYDRDLVGGNLGFDFPIWMNLRSFFSLRWHMENYAIRRPRIKDMLSEATEIVRSDSFFSTYFSLYYNLGIKNEHKLYFILRQNQNNSNITEYNFSRNEIRLGYEYLFPSQAMFDKIVRNFTGDKYAE